MTGMEGLRLAYGNYGANPGYALARRHMHLFKTTSEQLGAIAVSQRQWAQMNPWAQMRKPLTMEDYLNSRYIVEPFHLFDCCLVSNGGIAVIITSAERAKSLKRPPVYVPGMGQSAPENDQRTDREPGSPAVTASTPISRIRKRAASWSCETVTGALYCLAMTRRNSASSSLIRSPLTSS